MNIGAPSGAGVFLQLKRLQVLSNKFIGLKKLHNMHVLQLTEQGYVLKVSAPDLILRIDVIITNHFDYKYV